MVFILLYGRRTTIISRLVLGWYSMVSLFAFLVPIDFLYLVCLPFVCIAMVWQFEKILQNLLPNIISGDDRFILVYLTNNQCGPECHLEEVAFSSCFRVCQRGRSIFIWTPNSAVFSLSGSLVFCKFSLKASAELRRIMDGGRRCRCRVTSRC